MIISLRGTNGSGKSTVVRALLEEFPSVPIYGVLGPRRPEAYCVTVSGVASKVFVLGPYETPTGGCDNIQPYDLILYLIKKYAAKGHVLFEGVLVSSSYGRVGTLLEQWGADAVMAFMGTSLERCIANVQARRNMRGDQRPFNPANLERKYQQIVKSVGTIRAAGKVSVVHFDFGSAYVQLLALLRAGRAS